MLDWFKLAWLLAILLVGMLVGAAMAQLPMQPPPIGTRAAPPSYTGPGDVKTFAIWGGLRCYSQARATVHGAIAVLTRASDSTTTTINCLTNGDMDASSVSTFCNATTCTVSTLTDQTGGGHDFVHVAGFTDPTLTISCVGSFPCMFFNGSTGTKYELSSGFPTTGSPQAQPLTYTVLINRTGRTTTDQIIMEGRSSTNVGLEFNSSVNSVLQFAGSSVTKTANDNKWHAVQAVFNGASSIFNIDGSATTTNPGTRSLSGLEIGYVSSLSGDFGLTGDMLEVGMAASGFSAGDNTSMCNNEVNYWNAKSAGLITASC